MVFCYFLTLIKENNWIIINYKLLIIKEIYRDYWGLPRKEASFSLFIGLFFYYTVYYRTCNLVQSYRFKIQLTKDNFLKEEEMKSHPYNPMLLGDQGVWTPCNVIPNPKALRLYCRRRDAQDSVTIKATSKCRGHRFLVTIS